MMTDPTSRRSFLKTVSAGAAAASMTAVSYAKVVGANERISIAVIGCGVRGYKAHMPGVQKYAKSENIEITAVVDPWKPQRERASVKTQEWFGRAARKFVSHRDVLVLDDVDAVMIASCDHQHTTHLEAAAKAGKDAICEKPLARDMQSLRECYDAVQASDIVCQMGTQMRSRSEVTGCQKLYRSVVLGQLSRVEQRRNGRKPFWYSRLAQAKKSEVEWSEFLTGTPKRPFDAELFTGWMGYREFCDGSVSQLGVHFLDTMHYITGATLPTSCVAQAGTYVWKDEHRFTCPDHVESTWEYPEGFLVSYVTNFGNSSDNATRYCGTHGLLDLSSGSKPVVSSTGAAIPGTLGKEQPVEPVETTEHFLNWLQCLRSRETPNASIEAGYQHSVASIMSVRAMDTGRRQIYDADRREVREG